MSENLLQTKLNIPPLRTSLVARPRLIDRLNAGMDGKLILVSAQAGSGKTTLVAEWLSDLRFTIEDLRLKIVNRESPGGDTYKIENQIAWLSLDESDNDPRRFLDYLVAALKQIQADVGRSAEAMLRSPQPPPDEAILTALVNDLTAIARPFVLVLDDYHVIYTPPIHKQLNFLLEHQPSNMRLVIATREDPPLPLPRLRARGQVTEIRQVDLRFTTEESADFLNRVMGLNLSADNIAALERRTEGWIAGLQLAALSMRGREDLSGFIEAFTGSSHFVLDYLIEEVFNQQPEDVQEFLLKTSILERLSGSLCDALTGRTDSRRLLERLEHANLFIIPLDQSCTWYRYHRLFADLLGQRLQTAETFSEIELHRLASHWFEKEGFFAEAIQHSLAASDWGHASEVIGAQSSLMLSRGELATLLGWYKALPDKVIYQEPQLCMNYGWVLTLAGQTDSATAYLDQAERVLQGKDELLGQVLVAQAFRARTRGEYAQAIELSKRSLTLLAESDILSRGLATFTLGFSLCSAGHLKEAEPVLMEAYEATRASGNDYGRLTVLGLLGDIQSDMGKLHKVASLCKQTLDESGDSPLTAQIRVLLTTILYEWNELDSAEEQLAQAVKASQQMGDRLTEVDIHVAMIRIKLARGEPVAALELLNKAQGLIKERDFPKATIGFTILRAEIALAQGDIPSALYLAQQMMEGMGVFTSGLHLQVGVTQSAFLLTQAKFLLVQGRKKEAFDILANLYDRVFQTGFLTVIIKVRTMQAVAAESPAEALQYLREALAMAQPEGYIRIFLDRDEPMKLLLERYKPESGELKEYVQTLLAAFGGESTQGSRTQPLVEAMSERELEILRLMATGLSNREIAERLFITVGTAKSHVHHILEKLGTESRMQAAAKARELGLV
jgi:LuxR family maltose regulon positive regulatory protein